MFGRRYFGGRYFGPRYFGSGVGATPEHSPSTFGRSGAGGDDAPRIEIYEKRKVRRSVQDEDEKRKEELREILAKMRGEDPEAEEVRVAAESVIQSKKKTVAVKQEVIDAILGKRKEITAKPALIPVLMPVVMPFQMTLPAVDKSEEDDEEALLMLI